MKRRALLGAVAAFGTSGCLRLTQQQATGDQEPEITATTRNSPCSFEVRLDWSETVQPDNLPESNPNYYPGDTRELAFRMYEITVLDTGGDEILSYDVGNPGSDLNLSSGYFGREKSSPYYYRWTGKDSTVFLVGPIPADREPARIDIRGAAIESRVTATVSVGGKETGQMKPLSGRPRSNILTFPDNPECGPQ
jgi:hypothetical protein